MMSIAGSSKLSITDSASTQKNKYSTFGLSKGPDAVKETYGINLLTPDACLKPISGTPRKPSHKNKQTSIAEIDEEQSLESAHKPDRTETLPVIKVSYRRSSLVEIEEDTAKRVGCSLDYLKK